MIGGDSCSNVLRTLDESTGEDIVVFESTLTRSVEKEKEYFQIEESLMRPLWSPWSSGKTAELAIKRLWARIPKLTTDLTMTRLSMFV